MPLDIPFTEFEDACVSSTFRLFTIILMLMTNRVGDQHRELPSTVTGTANPFDEGPRRVSEYTAREVATLQSRLDKQLGPEYISARAGPSGQKVHYLAAEKCINLANEVFGFNGWSSSIQNIQIDFVSMMDGKMVGDIETDWCVRQG